MPRCRVLSGALVLVAATSVTACGARDDQLGRSLKSGAIGQAITMTAGQPFLAGSMALCLKGEGASAITVDDIRVLDGDLRLTGFVVRDSPFETDGSMIGVVRGTLAAHGLHETAQPRITERCDEAHPHHNLGYELIVELVADDHDTMASGFAVDYHGSNSSGTLEIGLETHACVDSSTRYCASARPTAQD